MAPTETELKTLQVKAELHKLGDPERAYSDKFNSQLVTLKDEDNFTASQGRITLASRFSKIEGAVRSYSEKKTLRLFGNGPR